MSIHKKLQAIQSKLKAPKKQQNNFGGYNYRSLEDIQEAVKPLLDANGCTVTLSDDIAIHGDRVYVKVTAVLFDTESSESVSVTAFAREPLNKKGMDESQITGAASSYARKYAMNGLFAIDDTEDTDTMSNQQPTKTDDVKEFMSRCKKSGLNGQQIKEVAGRLGVISSKPETATKAMSDLSGVDAVIEEVKNGTGN